MQEHQVSAYSNDYTMTFTLGYLDVKYKEA